VKFDNLAQQHSFGNAVGSINLDAMLPENVFERPFSQFVFFEADRLFEPSFMRILSDLLDKETANVACLLNLGVAPGSNYKESDLLFLNHTISGADYMGHLREKRSFDVWLYMVDRYVCASDVGQWTIYCEKGEDIAVCAFREPDGRRRFTREVIALNATPIEDIYRTSPRGCFAFSNLTADWRDSLAKSYLPSH
jgi:hypothetical protein